MASERKEKMELKRTLVIDGTMSQEEHKRGLDFEKKMNLSSFEKGLKIQRHFRVKKREVLLCRV